MPGTVVIEPPPPTISDPPPAPAPRARGRGCLVAVAALCTLACVMVAVGYFGFWRYEPHAREHIPDRTNVAVRFEAADFILFGPVRRHLWPMLEETRPEPKPAPKGQKSRVERIKDATGVNFNTDARELIIASMDAQSWIAIVGGRLTRGRFVKGMLKVIQDEGVTGWGLSGEILVGPGGFAIGQAEDGTLLFGSNAAIVTAALPATEEWKQLDLPQNVAVAMVVTDEAWKGIAGKLGDAPGADALAKIAHARGKMTLGDAPAVELTLKAAEGADSAIIAKALESALGTLRLTMLLAPDHYGEKGAIQGATVKAEGSNVQLRAPWPIEGLDRAFSDLAAAIRTGRALSGPADAESRPGRGSPAPAGSASATPP